MASAPAVRQVESSLHANPETFASGASQSITLENEDNLQNEMEKQEPIAGLSPARSTVTTSASLLGKLPNEIKNMILGNLDRVSSTCLGVACKSFYAPHRRMHETVELSETPMDYAGGWMKEQKYVKKGEMLANRLLKWVPRNLKYYSYIDGVFVTKQRFRELRKEWKRDEETEFRELVEEMYPGLLEREYVSIAAEYMSSICRRKGLKYEERRPMEEFVSLEQQKRSDRWENYCILVGWEISDGVSPDTVGPRWDRIRQALADGKKIYRYADS